MTRRPSTLKASAVAADAEPAPGLAVIEPEAEQTIPAVSPEPAPEPTVAEPSAQDRVNPGEISASAARMRTGASGEALLFSYVFNHGAPREKLLPSFLKVLSSAVELGHDAWPNEIKSLVWGKDVLDFGCGATLYGPVIRALGARSYTGIDKVIDPSRKRFRSRALKQTVSLDFSMTDAARVIPNISYMQADDVLSREAFDIVLLQSVTHVLAEPDKVLAHIHRSLRPGGEVWILHDNFYAWTGHQQQPRSPAAYDPENPDHQTFVDWGHIKYEPAEDHPFRTSLNRIRLRELRSLLDRYFEVDGWKEVTEKSAVRARLTPEIQAGLPGFDDSDLLTRHVVIRGRKRN